MAHIVSFGKIVRIAASIIESFPDFKESMNCTYCDQPVLGKDPITVPGTGPAHASCHHSRLLSERVFGSLKISSLSEHELNELYDLVMMERNVRSAEQSKAVSAGNDDVELFDDGLWA